MTLNHVETTKTENPWTQPNLKDDFSYLLELARSTIRSHDMIKNHVLRLGHSMADLCFKNNQEEMVHSVESQIKAYLHKHEIFEFDALIDSTFNTQVWRDTIKGLEQSYGRFGIADKNLLGSRRSPGSSSSSSSSSAPQTNADTLKHILKWAQQNPHAIPNDLKRDVLSIIDKTKASIQKESINVGIALEPPETEVEATRQSSLEKKIEQLKTPKYRIEEVHKHRQDIIKEGLKAVIDVFTQMYEKTVNEIPIQSDEEAYMIRDGFVDLANNYVSMDDDKHRMDFAGWANVLENIEKYGPEKGLKMSGTEITPEDINMIDKDTLPINYYPKYDKIGLSYISKEHLDSKGVVIANCFIHMMNTFAWQAVGAKLFSYQAKIRGIRAIAVSHKLMGTKFTTNTSSS